MYYLAAGTLLCSTIQYILHNMIVSVSLSLSRTHSLALASATSSGHSAICAACVCHAACAWQRANLNIQ